MNRSFSIVWVLIFLLLLLPSSAGKFAIDIAGGILAALLLIPITLGGLSWISWKIIKSKMVKCASCGATYFSNTEICSICGSTNFNQKSKNNIENNNNNIPASSATIDISAEETD